MLFYWKLDKKISVEELSIKRYVKIIFVKLLINRVKSYYIKMWNKVTYLLGQKVTSELIVMIIKM